MQWTKAACAGVVFSAVAIAATLSYVPAVTAKDHDSKDHDSKDHDSRIEIGFDAAPVHLNMKGKNEALVGLGSYLVNVAGDCNGCHSAGPQTEYLPGGNPYLNQPTMINTTTYLGGGRDFGFLGPPTNAASAHIISRNLTPDWTGLPEGGNTFDQFVMIMRTGVDPDQRHPNCTGTLNSGCLPQPFDGNLLQIMPWPNLKNLSDHDLRAIYEYLSAVPCIQGHDAYEPANRCG
jgi:hypothetical protein